MTREQAIRNREKLAAQFSSPREVLRGSLLQRTIHHSSGCLKCARGEGHPLWVLTVGYPGGKTRQVSLRPDQVPQVRKAIEHYHHVKRSLEAISELNQFLLRLDRKASRVAGQAKKFSREIAEPVKGGNLAVLHKAKQPLDEMVPRVQQVLRQTRERVLGGNTQADGKLLSLLETHTEVVGKGKANKPNEFGKLVLILEAENQIIPRYQVCEQRPADSTLLEGSVEQHVQPFRRAPQSVAADPIPDSFPPRTNPRPSKWGSAGYRFRATTPRAPHASRGRSKRWFKKPRKWRTGWEGRISVLKRRHGLRRSLYTGPDGIRRWVGLGVIADNVIHIGTHLAEQACSQ